MRHPLLVAPLFFAAIACGNGTLVSGDAGPADAATSQLPPITADGGTDGTATAQPVEGVYFGACLSTLAAGRIDRVLRFYTEINFTPDVTGGAGKISLKLTPMKLGPSNGSGYDPPPTVSKDQVIGAAYSVTDAPTNAKGVYAAPLGTVTVPGAANPISGRDIVVDQAAVPGRFGFGRFCSQLSGHVTTPVDLQLDGASNTCIYIPVNEGDPTPTLKASDFSATCSLN